MPYTFQPSVIMARRHRTQTVFLTEADCWTQVISEAELIDDEAHGDIRLLDAEISGTDLSDIRLAPVVEGAGTPVKLADSALSLA
ncbi:MAG: DUF2849 domain-containing protein [Pseudomonadota bacterium]